MKGICTMNLKKLGMTLFVVLALGAVMASSALAAAVPKAATWRTGAGGTVLTGEESVSSTGSGELITNVGTTTLVLKSTGLSCVSCKIKNESGNAVGTGSLKFTGVTVVKPANCVVENAAGEVGVVNTVPLNVNAGFMGGAGSGNTVRFKPASGTEFTTVFLEGPSCSIAGPYEVKGEVFVRSNNATGVYELNQTVTSSGLINEEGSGVTNALTFGTEIAKLEGTGTFTLSGGKKGTVFGTHE
jgi:hypothetical protein